MMMMRRRRRRKASIVRFMGSSVTLGPQQVKRSNY
jgi:hypothetical protein